MADEHRTVMKVFLKYQRTIMDALADMREELLEVEQERMELEYGDEVILEEIDV
jgi:hypothetical protein